MKLPSFLMVIIAVGSLALTGCSNKGEGLAGDQENASSCPASGCADMTPAQSQLSITGPGKAQIYAPVPVAGAPADDQIEFGGDCYASTYPSNRIMVAVAGVAVTASDLTSTRGIDGSIACRQGRYGFAINGAKLPLNSIASVTVNIVGVDATGTTYTNTAGGQYSVKVYRTSQ